MSGKVLAHDVAALQRYIAPMVAYQSGSARPRFRPIISESQPRKPGRPDSRSFAVASTSGIMTGDCNTADNL